MGNYELLKAAINEVIKANGRQEITGEVLNQVLLSMVNSLGAGYQCMGVATPSTNPGTPDQNVFYFATQAGTYTNFNAIVLQAGISVLIWNGAWTSQTWFTIDSIPTNNSQNLIASGAVFNALKLDGGAYDVSAHNSGATFASLSALLNSANLNTLIPTEIRHGGMSIKFVQSSDNKYIQFRYMSSSTTVADFTNVANWQGVDDKPTAGSDNLVKSGGVFNAVNILTPLTPNYVLSGYKITEDGIVQISNGNCYVGIFTLPQIATSIIIKGSTAYNSTIGPMAEYAFINAPNKEANILECSEMLSQWSNFEKTIEFGNYQYLAVSGYDSSDRNMPSAKAVTQIKDSVEKLNESVGTLEEIVSRDTEKITALESTNIVSCVVSKYLEGFRIADGAIVEAVNGNWRIRIYNVGAFDSVKISGSVSSNGSLYALLSSLNTSDIFSVSEQISTWENFNNINVDVSQAAYIAVCYYNSTDRQEALCSYLNTEENINDNNNYKKYYNRLFSQKKGLGADVLNFVDCLQVAIVTDVHGYGYAPAQHSLSRTIQCANKMGTVDAIFVLGDIPMGDPKEGSEQWYFNIMNNSLKPIYPVVGNHCVGNSDEVSKAISHNEAYTMWIEPFESNNESVNPNDKCYYYKDFTEKKIRLIALYDYDDNFVVDGDTYSGKRGTYVYGQTQLQWLADTLYSTPSDYGVVIIKHEPIDLSVEAVTSNKFCTREEYVEKHRQIRIINNPLNEGQTLPELINAYINGTDFSKQITTLGETFTISKDFSNRGEGEFICYLGGHTHLDMVLKSEDYNQYQFISQSTTPTMKSSTPYPPIDQYRDDNIEGLGDAINIVTFDRTKKLVKLCRVGVKDVDDGYLRDFDAIKL